MALVTIYDPDGNEFQKEPVDARECIKHLGWTKEKPEPKKVAMTAAQLKEWLTASGIEFASNASKADLQALFDANQV